MEDLDVTKLPFNLDLYSLDIVFHKYWKQETQLLIDQVVLFLPPLSHKSLKLLLCNSDFLESTNENYISQVVWKIKERVS
jgi:hypothetical protein